MQYVFLWGTAMINCIFKTFKVIHQWINESNVHFTMQNVKKKIEIYW